MDETEAYESVRLMILKEVNAVKRQFRIPEEDLIAEANLAFCEAWREYDESKGALTTKVWWEVLGGLTRVVRQVVRDRKRLVRDFDLTRFPVPAGPALSDLKEVLNRLSVDGQQVVNTVFEPPEYVLNKLRKLGVTAETVRTSIWLYLKDSGWSQARIRNAFQEVKAAV
jgi:hypothetical protein